MEYRITRRDDYLQHHGVKGQKHGERRYQNPDGSLTPEGREHYGVGDGTGGGSGSGAVSGTSAGGGKQSGSFISRHKKGLAIAGGLLAAGVAAVAISQIAKSNSAKKGQETVKSFLDKDGYDTRGYMFKNHKTGASGYLSPDLYKLHEKSGTLKDVIGDNYDLVRRDVYNAMRRG